MATPYDDMVVGPNDGKQQALVKLAYWLDKVAVSLGVSSVSSLLLPSMAPQPHDGQQELLVKAAYWAQQISANLGGGAAPLLSGVGSPNGVKTGLLGQRYRDTVGGTFYTNIDGNTSWAVG